MKSYRIDGYLLFFSIALSVIGIVTIFGGSDDSAGMAIRKLIWLLLGIGLMFLFAFYEKLNYQIIGSYAFIILGVLIVLLLLTLVPFIGTKVKGARSWIRIAGLGFQPAEFVKLALVLALARYLVLKETQIENVKELWLPFIISFVPIVLIAVQPDLGSAFLLIPILFSMLFIGGANISLLAGFMTIGIFTLFVPMYLEYQKYIMVDDIYNTIKDTHIKIADAVRILNFEVWHYMENKTTVPLYGADTLKKWAIKIVSMPENRKIFFQTVAALDNASPNYLKNFLMNDLAMVIIITLSSVVYGISMLLRYFSRMHWLRGVTIFTLIISLSFLGSFALRKMVTFKPHQVTRIVSFANPDKFQKGAGYQLRHSLIAMGSGQIVGKGLFGGDMTRGEIPFLPEWNNDFIFSVIGEQFGFLGVSVTLALFFGLIIRGIIIAIESKDDFGSLLAGGITFLFFFHILINIGITMGLFPVTGIPLIFLSSGGSNLIVTFISVGILMNINARKFINAN